MKKPSFLFLSILLLWLAPLPRAKAAEVTVDLFYNALAPEGEWLETGDYGYVWHPSGVEEKWRPYTDGRWVYSDAGWTFVSDEPWGWATYHYGRWVQLDDPGWVWVPDTEWAPAWVSWRHSDRHIGWAPLPPEARFERSVGIERWADSYYDIGPEHYTFVEVRQFGAPRMRDVILEPRENVTIITETRNVTNITYRNNVVFVGGPEYDEVSTRVERPIQRVTLERRTDVDFTGASREGFASRVQGDRLQIVAPSVTRTVAALAPPKNARRMTAARVEHGWAGIADQAAAQKVRTQIQGEAKAPAALPPKPKFERAAATAATGAPSAAPSEAPASAAQPPTSKSEQMTGASPAASAAASPATRRRGKPGMSPPPGVSPAASPEGSPATPRSRRRAAASAAPTASETSASPAASPAETKPRRERGTTEMVSPTPARNKRPRGEQPSANPAASPGSLSAPAEEKVRKIRDENSPPPGAVEPSAPSRHSPEGGAAQPAPRGKGKMPAESTTVPSNPEAAPAEHRARALGNSSELKTQPHVPNAGVSEKSAAKGGKKETKHEGETAAPAALRTDEANPQNPR